VGKTSIKNKVILSYLSLLLIFMIVVGVVNYLTNDFILTHSLTGALALAIGIIFGHLFSSSFVNRLKTLGSVAREVSQGDLAQEIKVQSQDEMRELEEGLAVMLADLRRLITEMNQLTKQVGRTQLELSPLVKKVSNNSLAIEKAAQKIAQRSEAQSDIVRKTALILDKSLAAMDAMSHKANEMFGKINEAQLKTEAGEAKAHQTLWHLENVFTKMARDTEPLARLAAKIERIKVVVDFMDEIAQKTDLLSLNASIESTRAGESGQGIALIADEIRHMAESSKYSSHEVRLMVEDIIEDNQEVTTSLAQNQKAIDESRQIAQILHRLFGESLEGVSLIAEALKSLEGTIGKQVHMMNGLGSSFEELTQLAQDSFRATQRTSLQTKKQQADIVKIAHAIQALSGFSQQMMQAQGRFKVAS
jgi:methyl-accepting chemotaxis protein